MFMKKGLSLCASAILLTACASGSHVVTGTQRAAIDVEVVKVYSEAPKTEYEVVGSIEASSSRGMTQQGRMDSAIEALKEEAAEIGANGIIVSNFPNHSGGISTQVSTGISGGSRGFSSGLGTGITIHPAAVKGTAVYVFDVAELPSIKNPTLTQ
ncbi:hypothetical protein ACPUEK_11385 [Marinomonas gallaica]|uniref:hypothetical protein n=1 Tax=Marinomonas gallaica TaxID=1806667 RepID=UPI000831158F|nr:hypothetical protein [Marinomonas gallaica]